MQILLLSPVPRTSRKGNRMTTDRWERLLTEMGHEVRVRQEPKHETPDLLLALHARRNAEAVRKVAGSHPSIPIVLALTGTDVYRDIHEKQKARETLDHADRFIVLQPLAIDELPEEMRDRAHVVYQSIGDVPEAPAPLSDCFEVCVIGHLRSVKDPFRAEEASRRLTDSSKVRIHHIGGELEEGMAAEAKRRMEANPRYRWLKEKPRKETLRILGRSRLVVHSSIMEGGAHVISEAIACGTPVLASDIPGNVGLLGEDYPGYYPVRDTDALAQQLAKVEGDSSYLQTLRDRVVERRDLVDPNREKEQLRDVLTSF